MTVNRIIANATLVAGLALGLGLSDSTASAALLAEDAFLVGDPADGSAGEYAVGALDGQSPTTTGFSASTWNLNNVDGQDTSFDVQADGLNYAGLLTAGGAVSAVSGEPAGSEFAQIGRTLASNLGAGESTLYFSYLIKRSTSTGQAAVNFTREVTSGPMQFGIDGSAFFVMLDADGIGGAAVPHNEVSGGSYAVGDTALLVLRLSLDENGSETASLFINPDPTAGEPTSADLSVTGEVWGVGDALNVAQPRFGSNAPAGDDFILDELRVGTTFADVTPVPEPATLALVGLGGLVMLSGRRWNAWR